jgi:dynein heavy chain
MKLANIFDQKRNPPMPKPKAVANRMYRDLMEFKDFVPIIRSLCNEGLQERHIDLIFMEMKINKNHYKKLEDMSITDLKGFGVDGFRDKLDEISDQASKEFANKNSMYKMKEEWEALSFDCKMLPGKESFILNGEAVEAIQTALDDHIIKTQTMKGSPFAKFMINDVLDWEKSLMETTENLEMWLKVQ